MPQVVNIEPTPNPEALKFVVRERLLASGARSFKDAGQAAGDPLAAALFALGNVLGVFYMDRFVTITKAVSVDWTDLIDPVCEILEAHAASAEETGSPAVADGGDALFARILHLVDTRVRPGLAGDGGGLEIISFEDPILTIAYQGACGSCPAATTGTLHFIQGLLQQEVDPRIQVVSV